ncbi:MAG TPA: membrane protein insertion efficiency factor YidD [Patescibacteria group bacterium]|nr:membrane protein insertion efficiency factor YidD [Patescibacteria group bacterium]
MKYSAIFLLSCYQIVLAIPLRIVFGLSCRYEPTCSAYAKRMIREKGFFLGAHLVVKRLLSCHPFAKGLSGKV